MTMRGLCLETCATLAVALLSGASRAQSEAPCLAVIVHPDNPTAELTMTQLRAYCMLDYRKWDDGNAAVLYLRPGASMAMRILRQQVYRMSAMALRKYWHDQEFQGKITVKPSVIPTAAAAIQRIRANPGAFTVVLAKDVPETGVRVLKIDGKKPGEAGYPLVGSEM